MKCLAPQASRGRGVRHRLLRGEGLRHHDDQRACRIAAFQRSLEVLRVDVRGEAHSSAPSPSASASRRGPRSEPPVPRFTMRLKGFSLSRSLVRKALSRASVCFTFGGRRVAAAQGGVPGGALLGEFTSAAGQERLAPFREAALGREVGEEAQRYRPEALARVVVAHAGRLGHELAAAGRVAGEELAQVRAAPGLRVVRELLPGLALEVGGVVFISALDRGGSARPCRRAGRRRRASPTRRPGRRTRASGCPGREATGTPAACRNRKARGRIPA